MKQALQLGTLAAANLGFAFLFQWYVLTQLGPGAETDALFAGMTLPQLVLLVISGSLMHVLVPLLAGEADERLHHDAWSFLILVGGLFGALAVILFATAQWWVPVTVPGFSKETQDLTVELTRIQLIGMVLAAMNGVQWAVYHARQKFIWPELSPIIASVAGLALLVWLLPIYGIKAAAWIGTLRLALQTLFLMPALGKPVWPDLKGASISMAWSRIKPLLLGTSYYKTDTLVERVLLSTATSGSLSLYYMAQQIYSAGSQIINKAIAAPLVPQLSKLHKIGNMQEFRRTYNQGLLRVGVIGIAALLLLGLSGQYFLGWLIGYGSVSINNLHALWWMMIWLGGAFVGSLVGQISSSTFYAAGDTATPTRVGIYTYTIYLPVKVMLFYFTGIMGMALATSAFFMVNFVIQDRLIRGKYITINAG